MAMPSPVLCFLVALIATPTSSAARLYSAKRSMIRPQTQPHQILDNFHDDCRMTPGLTPHQRKMCERQPELTSVALRGLTSAVQECHQQFQAQRWNCSLSKRNPFNSPILARGFKETAFVHALGSAAVAISVARACSSGLLRNCGCDRRQYDFGRKDNQLQMRKNSDKASSENEIMKYGGCSPNLPRGMRFSKAFLDRGEDAGDFPSNVTLHNYKIGRQAVAKNMKLSCMCHGVSGSCQLKTCFRAVPPLRLVGETLMKKYQTAKLKQLDNGRSRQKPMKSPFVAKRIRKKNGGKSQSSELWYYEKMDPCDPNRALDLPGTSGRVCSLNSTARENSCNILCCARGYNTILKQRQEPRRCHFEYCCDVKCEEVVTIDEEVHVCK